MARRKTRTLTEVELEFMQMIWSAGEVTTEDVMRTLRAKGRPLSDGTVRKMFSILVEKGYLRRRPHGRGFLYEAKVDRERATRSMAEDLLKRAFGGSAALMVAALMESRAVDPQDLEAIKQMIAEKEKEGR